MLPDPEGEELKDMTVASELAMRRARRMIEFMRAVCENEAQILPEEPKTAGDESAIGSNNTKPDK
jgi:hypothetical protein